MPGKTARLRAIIPITSQITAQYTPQRIQSWLKKTGEEFKKEMQFYPPQLPGSSYMRTGTYKRGWQKAPVVVTPATVTVENTVRYARRVGGPKRTRTGGPTQTQDMARRGWPSQTDISRAVIRKRLPILRKAVLPLRNVPGAGQ